MNDLIKTYPALLEKEIWIDGEGKRKFIENMDKAYRTNVVNLLQKHIRDSQHPEEIKKNELLKNKIWELENL